jgi:uncharacterized protein
MIRGIILITVSITTLSALLYLIQPSLFFYPYRELIETPKHWGLEYDDVYLDSSDGIRIHGWYIPHKQAKKVVLFFHGNGGNISHRGDSIKIFNQLGVNVLIIDYQGYGNSNGSAGEKEFYQDARSAWQYLIEQRGFKHDQIILFGRSIGAAVATKLSVETKPEKLILESAFSSSRDMADKVLPLISRITMIRYPFNSLQRIKDINAQLLMLHSPDDDIVPYYLGKKLYQSANQPKQFVELKGNHNYGFMLSQPEYQQALDKFINSKNKL